MTPQTIMEAIADGIASLTEFLKTPGISDKNRKSAQKALKAQERHKKDIERILRSGPKAKSR